MRPSLVITVNEREIMWNIRIYIFIIGLVIWSVSLSILWREIGFAWVYMGIWLSTILMVLAGDKKTPMPENMPDNIQQSHARQFKEPTTDVNNATKIGLYFVKKAIADRLKAGEHLPEYEIILWGYNDLGPGDNRQRVRENDPESLIACDLLLGETS